MPSVASAKTMAAPPRIIFAMSYNLFDEADETPWSEPLCSGAAVLRRFALKDAAALLSAVEHISTAAPFRNMLTPNGYQMSVAMSNCGSFGWVSDRRGYRYDPIDPASGAEGVLVITPVR